MAVFEISLAVMSRATCYFSTAMYIINFIFYFIMLLFLFLFLLFGDLPLVGATNQGTYYFAMKTEVAEQIYLGGIHGGM